MQHLQRLKEARLSAGRTQQEIADFLQVKQQQYSRWELGNVSAPIEVYMTLARFYGVTVDYLCGLSE